MINSGGFKIIWINSVKWPIACTVNAKTRRVHSLNIFTKINLFVCSFIFSFGYHAKTKVCTCLTTFNSSYSFKKKHVTNCVALSPLWFIRQLLSKQKSFQDLRNLLKFWRRSLCTLYRSFPYLTNTETRQAVQKVRETYNSGVTRCLKWRRKQLRNLYRMYEENANLMLDVLYQDLRRSKTESLLLEIDYMKNDLKHVLYNLDSWTKPERVSRRLLICKKHNLF